MMKSSRFWWLHGAILMAAAAGCRNNGGCGPGGCGPTQSGPPPVATGAAYGASNVGSPRTLSSSFGGGGSSGTQGFSSMSSSQGYTPPSMSMQSPSPTYSPGH